MEEQGERFRLGDKAQRNYERSLALYQRASGYEQTYDSLYNTARVLYILSTSFYLPPTSIPILQQSVAVYRAAINLLENQSTAEKSFSSPNPSSNSSRITKSLLLDGKYNFAQSLLELSELGKDIEPRKEKEIEGYRIEALELLNEVARGQLEWVNQRAKEDAEGSEINLEASSEASSAMDQSEADEGMEVDGDGDEQEDADESDAYETTEPTPSALIETYLLIIDTIRQSDSLGQRERSEVQNALESIRMLSSQVPSALVEAELAAIEVGVEVAKQEAAMSAGDGSKQMEEIKLLLERVPSIREQENLSNLGINIKAKISTLHIEILSWKAKVEATPSRISQSTSSPAWITLTLATTTAITSVDLPVPILDAPLYKPSVLLDLATLSLRRAALSCPPAEKNRAQLIINAETYSNRALDALGWGYYASTNKTFGVGMMTPKIPHQGGWERESLGRKAVYRLGQVFLKGSRVYSIDQSGAEGKLKIWVEKIKALNAVPERQLSRLDLNRIAEEDEEEGLGKCKEEVAFWTEYMSML